MSRYLGLNSPLTKYQRGSQLLALHVYNCAGLGVGCWAAAATATADKYHCSSSAPDLGLLFSTRGEGERQRWADMRQKRAQHRAATGRAKKASKSTFTKPPNNRWSSLVLNRPAQMPNREVCLRPPAQDYYRQLRNSWTGVAKGQSRDR